MSDPLPRLTSNRLLLTIDRWCQRSLVVACWVYFAGAMGVWVLIRWAGDLWWLATFVMFAPRWVWLLPLLVLAPIALIRRQRFQTHTPLLLGAAVVFFCVMGFRIPGSGWFSRSETRFRVLTCNVQGEWGSRAAIRELISKHEPDAVLLQESLGWDEWDEEKERVFPEDWQIRQAGSLLIATPHPILQKHEHRRLRPLSSGTGINGLYCLVDSPLGPVGVCSVHMHTPREGLYTVLDRRTGVSPGRSGAVTDETEWRRVESEDLAVWLRGWNPPTVVAGDFNMPVESAIYRRYWSERDNTFCQSGWGFGATKITRVRGIRYGLRIDHILADPKFNATRARVINPIGSDHLPLMADLVRR